AQAQGLRELPTDAGREKALAKAQFEAAQAPAGAKARAKLEAAKALLEARMLEVASGTKTIDEFVPEAAEVYAEARLAVAERPEERIRALEEAWLVAMVADIVTTNRVAIPTAMEAKYRRLRAEERLAKAVAAYARQSGRPPADLLGAPPKGDRE